ncbi:MAG: hypothetical protein EYC70_10090 [Planctomycetota bacterium]|nr:MAG: hypothetical protein EYC70_10090 [Planctomycetota bacterium]
MLPRRPLPPPLPILLLIPFLGSFLALGGCSTDTVRLYELREAPAESAQYQAYQRLEKAVALANEFLRSSPDAVLFPAEGARFSLSFTDILVTFEGEGIEAVRMETPGWGDLRTVLGDGYHPTDQGFLTQRVSSGAEGSGTKDASFLKLSHDEMAAVLLRQVTMQREVQTRGGFDYWINYDLLGLWPANGWGEDNPVNRRAYAVEAAFRRWLAARGSLEPSDEDLRDAEGEEPVRQPQDYQEPT